jgi:hypothetical protein
VSEVKECWTLDMDLSSKIPDVDTNQKLTIPKHSRLLKLEYVILKDAMDPQNRDAPRLTQIERADTERQITRCQNLIPTASTSLLAIDPNINAVKSWIQIGAGKCPSDWPFKLARRAEDS